MTATKPKIFELAEKVILDSENEQINTLELLKNNGILATPFGPQTIRFCTHLDVDAEMIEKVIDTLKELDQ